jgi:hypothetical protein
MGISYLTAGFNKFIGMASYASSIPGMNQANKGVAFLAGELKTVEGLKTWVVAPLAAVAALLDYKGDVGKTAYPILDRIGGDFTEFKNAVSAFEVITYLPDFINAIATKANNGAELAQKGFNIAAWVITVADVIMLAKKYIPVNARLENAASWIYPSTILYMGGYSLVKDVTTDYGEFGIEPNSKLFYRGVCITRDVAFIATSLLIAYGMISKGKPRIYLG